jgi:hypothetical protein
LMAPHADGLDVVVGAHPACNAPALFIAMGFRAKSFRPPSEGESLSLEWPRESNQREGHPASAPCGHPVRKVREPGPGFSTGHPALAKRSRHPCRLPLRGLSTPPRRCRGAPGKAAGLPGPHSSEELEQSKNRSAKPKLRTDASSFFEDEAMQGSGLGSLLSTQSGNWE